MSLLGFALSLYLVSLGGALLLREYQYRKKGKRLLIPYDRLPIAVALVLLVAAAAILAGGNEDMADDFAIMAYYLLVLGVILQIVSYIREQHSQHKGGKENPPAN